ncbi:hypothetical protein GGF31_008485 [Allomyces arbusculus]|nr:hypothetical protein GGF31_008485 [Allomyces arbusculus]
MAASDATAEKASSSQVEKQKSSFVVDEQFEHIVAEIAPTTDDQSTPSLTFRVWVLGLLFCVSLSFINQVFSFSTNGFYVTAYVATLLSFPLGKLMAAAVPRVQFNLFGLTIDTNPGPFSIKEHVLIGIWGSTGAAGIYGTDNLVVQELFFNLDIGHGWSILFLLATSTLGFGISGVSRKFLVRPAHMIWPTVLPSVALYTAFHGVHTKAEEDADKEENAKGQHGWSRMKMFTIAAIAAFFLYFFGPGYMASMLQYFPLLCWFAPNNPVINRIGSPKWGPGPLSFTLDLTALQPSLWMALPFWAAVNQFASAVLFTWILTPAAWLGEWYGQPPTALPFNTSALFDKNGLKFTGNKKITLMNDKNELIDAVYDAHKPVFMSTYFIWSYCGSMGQFTSSIVHSIVWFGKDIVSRFSAARHDRDEYDIHCQLMDKYPEVPDKWYYLFFALTATLSIVTCHFSGVNMAWYYTVFAIVVAIVGTIPIAIVLATAGVSFGMNVISEFIIGCIEPGKPIVMMAFKCLAVTVTSQCVTLLADLKIGHYLKVPPRHVFISQLVSQFVAAFVAYFSMRWWLSNPDHRAWGIDEPQTGPGAPWTMRNYRIYYNASIIWGAIGPIRFFFESAYSLTIILGFVLGAVLPIVLKLADMYLPGSFWKFINVPILFSASSPGGNNAGLLSGFATAVFFQWFMYNKRQAWWKKYNYVLATGLDIGTALSALLVTLVLQNNGLIFPEWFLNDPNGNTERFGEYGDWCFLGLPEKLP